MKTEKFRRSNKIEDYRDHNQPGPGIDPIDPEFAQSINEMIKITNSTLAADLGAGDIKKRETDGG